MLITAQLPCPFGTIEIQITSLGLRRLRFVDATAMVDSKVPQEVEPFLSQLEDYFAGHRKVFDLPIDWTDIPPFHREVLKMVYTIPFGKTRTYKQIATVLGRPNASRAIGQANRKNPIALVIPCHRVIGAKGDLTGYAYGLVMKRNLLAFESPSTYAPQAQLFELVSS